MRRAAAILLLGLATGSVAPPARAESYDPGLLRELRWRMIGPHRGGRTKAAAGIPDRPNVFYVGVCNGGVWKTDDYGRTWTPIFDDQPTGSDRRHRHRALESGRPLRGQRRGAAAARPLHGRRHLQVDGRRTHVDASRPARRPADPADRRSIRVIPTGSSSRCSAIPYGPNAGARRLPLDGRRRDLREGPLPRREHGRGRRRPRSGRRPHRLRRPLGSAAGAVGERRLHGPGSGLYKSTDGGTTWRPIVKGLPTFAEDGLGRIGITVAPSDPRRLFATVEAKRGAGLYRSDDAGETWALINADPRVTDRASDFAEVKVDPQNPDIGVHGQHRDLEVDGRRAARSPRCAARPAATTTIASGSTRASPTSC